MQPRWASLSQPLAFDLQPRKVPTATGTDFAGKSSFQFDANLAARLGVQDVTDLEEHIFLYILTFFDTAPSKTGALQVLHSFAILPLISIHQLKHAKTESSSLFKVHVQRNCLPTTDFRPYWQQWTLQAVRNLPAKDGQKLRRVSL